MDVKLSHCLSITADKKPEILNKNQTIVVQKGDQAVLHCNATGGPSPGFTWEKNSTCPGYHRNGQPLVLDNVTMSVAGTYKCIATNSLGRDESDFTLVVNGKFGYFSVKKQNLGILHCVFRCFLSFLKMHASLPILFKQ